MLKLKTPTKHKTKKRETKRPLSYELKAARALATEDLRVGDGVAVAHVTLQVLACDDPPPGATHNRVLRADYIPHDAGDPLRVIDVCLPFVLAVNVARQHVTLDLRRQHLVRLDSAYTEQAFKKLGDKRSRSAR